MLTGQAGKVFATLYLCWCFAAPYCAGIVVYECYSETAICCDGDMSIIAVEWIGNNTVLVDKNNSITTVAYSENFHSYLNLSICFAMVEQVQLSCCPLDDNYTTTCENYTWSNPRFKGTTPTEEDSNNGGDTTTPPMVTTPTEEGLNNGVDTTIIISIVVPTVIVSAIVLILVINLLCYKKKRKTQYAYDHLREDGNVSYILGICKLKSFSHVKLEEVARKFPRFKLNFEKIRRENHSDEECKKQVIEVVLQEYRDLQWNDVVCVFDKLDQDTAKKICREKCPGDDYDAIVSQPASSSQTVTESDHTTAHVYPNGSSKVILDGPTVPEEMVTRSASQDTVDDEGHQRPEERSVVQETITEQAHMESSAGKAGTSEQIQQQQKKGKLTRPRRTVLPHSGTAVTRVEVHGGGEDDRLQRDTDETHQPRRVASRQHGAMESGEDHHDINVAMPFSALAGGASLNDVRSSVDDAVDPHPIDQAMHTSPTPLDKDCETTM